MTVPEIAESARCAHITVRRHIHRLLRSGDVGKVGTRTRRTMDGTKGRGGRGWILYAARPDYDG